MIHTFGELLTLLEKGEVFPKNWQVSQPCRGLAVLFDERIKNYFVGPELWNDNQKFLDRKKNFGNLSVFYVVDHQQLISFPCKLTDQKVQKIILPISNDNFREMVNASQQAQKHFISGNRQRRQTNRDVKGIKHVLSISRQLNGVRDVPKLLHLILEKAREITKADAGSIYEVEVPNNDIHRGTIHFRFTHNYSLQQDLTSYSIPVNKSSVVGNCVISRESINISDAYQLTNNCRDGVRELQHDRSFDKILNYQTHSMLTTPIFDISRQVIGVIQLLNRKLDYRAKLHRAEDFAKQVVPFNQRDIEHVEIVAQQSGIALENARMHDEIQGLFDGFVNASVTIIEQRDPTTSGHSHRVAELTIDLAEVVNKVEHGQFKKVSFSEDQFKELRYAALLHDFGKIGVRENVLVKAKKMYPWQQELLLERFELIKASYEIDYLRKMLTLYQEGRATVDDIRDEMYLRDKNRNLDDLNQILNFIQQANEPTVLVEQGERQRLIDIRQRIFHDLQGNERTFLTDDDVSSLSIAKGSLTTEEFREIQEHATHTFEFLKKIPWGKKLANIPEIAGKHHEKLDGSGYPNNITADDIPIQTRIMTVADIFDALTAADRPYKKSLSPEKALQIMAFEVDEGKLDRAVFDLFVEAKDYLRVLPKAN